jgi:hypothetical protein
VNCVENTYESIEGSLRPLIVDDESAAEVFSALHDVAWVSLASTATSYSEAMDLAVDHGERCFTWGWRSASDFIAGARGKGESSIELYAELAIRSGTVSESIRRLMESLGLRPVL